MAQRTIRIAYGLAWVALLAASVALATGIWNAWRDWRGPNRLIVPLCLDRTAMAQVFYDQGQGIRGEDSASVPLAGGGTALRELAFPVPRVPLRELRFDPMPFAGKFMVGAPRLESASGRLIAKFPLTAVVPRYQVEGWQREGDHWTGVTAAGGDDPQLTLGLGSPLRVGKPRIPWLEALALLVTGGATIGLSRRKELGGWRFFSAVGEGLEKLRNWAMGPGRGPLLTGAGLVTAGQLWLLWPLHRVIEWPLWDEPNYAARGLAWAIHGGSLQALHTSPLYVVMYSWLSGLGGVGAMVCAQHYVVKLGPAILLFFVLARWWRSAPAAAAAALLWATSSFQLEWPLLVYQGAWLWFLAALVTADRWPIAALGFTALAACVRQEYQSTAAVLLVCYSWRAWRQHWSWRTWLAGGRGWVSGAILAAVVWAGAFFVLAHADLRMGSSGDRMWFAFEQHYAARAVNTHEVNDINPWLDYGSVMARDFPGADSLRSAWRVNAAGVKHHLAYNLSHVGSELAALWTSWPGLVATAWVLFIATLAATAGGRPKASLESEGETAVERVPASAVLAASALLAVAPGLIVMAKQSYLLALVPGVFGALGWLWWRVTRWATAWRAGLGGVALVTLVVGSVMLARAPQPFVPGDRARPVAETVVELKKIWPATGRSALLAVAASTYAQYLGEDRCQAIEALTGVSGRPDEPEVSIEHVLAEVKPRAVLVTDEWRGSPRFDGKKLARLLAGPEWTMREVPAGQLYVRTGR